jgi:hypothetical protein
MFAAAPGYLVLVRLCLWGGLGAAVMGVFATLGGIVLPPYSLWWVFVGGMVCSAGILATMALPSISFDLREKTYRRRDSAFGFGRTVRGSIANIDAVVITAHHDLGTSLVSGGQAVEFRLVLHWRGGVEPPLLAALDYRRIPPGMAPSQAGAMMLQLGQRVATALEKPAYDNTTVIA